MANENQSKLVSTLEQLFTPIVCKDKDIQEFIEKNQLDQMESMLVTYWLVSTAAACYLTGTNDPKYKDDIMEFGAKIGFAEEQLSKKYDHIREVLNQVLQDNIAEWFEIIEKSIHDTYEEYKDSNDPTNISDPAEIVNFYAKILFPIMMRENDIIGFVVKFDSSVMNKIANLMCLSLLYEWTRGLCNAKGTIERDVLARNCHEVKECLTHTINDLLSDIKPNVGSIPKLKKDITKILDKHFKVLINAMYKEVIRVIYKK